MTLAKDVTAFGPLSTVGTCDVLILFKRRATFAWIVLISGALAILFSSRVCVADDVRKGVASQPSLSGAIKDSFGRPIAGAEVRLEDRGRVVVRTHTDRRECFCSSRCRLGPTL